MDPCISMDNELFITEITSHILEDLGTIDSSDVFTPYYHINHTHADKAWFGYKRGCNFSPDPCTSTLIIYPPNTVKCMDVCASYLFIIPISLEGATMLADQTIIQTWVPTPPGTDEMIVLPWDYELNTASGYNVDDVLIIGIVLLGVGVCGLIWFTYRGKGGDGYHRLESKV